MQERNGQPTSQPTPHASAAPWPEGVIARYLTVGGATVDIHEQREGWRSPHWFCRGCPDTSLGAYTGPFGDPFTLADIREQAQAHAEKCRALPKPEDARASEQQTTRPNDGTPTTDPAAALHWAAIALALAEARQQQGHPLTDDERHHFNNCQTSAHNHGFTDGQIRDRLNEINQAVNP